MNLSFTQVCILKHICIKAQQFELAARFSEEEKRLWKKMPKSEKQKWEQLAKSTKQESESEIVAKIELPFPIKGSALNKLNSKLWKLTNLK